MSRRRRNNKNTVPSDYLPPSVGVRTPRHHQQQLPSSIMSSPLPSDASTPSPRFEESQQPTHNHDTLLGDDSPIPNMQTLDSLSVDGEDYETDDGDDGIGGNNLTTYMDYPIEALYLYSEENKHLIQRQVEELIKLMNANGIAFTGVKLTTYEGGFPGQEEELRYAEQFEEAFIGALIAQAGVDSIDVFTLDVLKPLCKNEERWGKGKSADEKAEHNDRTIRFLDGSRSFIKNQYKEKGEGAFDHAPRNKVDKDKDKNKGPIKMSTVRNIYLQEIFLEMSLNSVKNDEIKTLFMTEHVGAAIKISNGDWTGSNAFNKLLDKEKDELLKAAKQEKIEEDKRKAHEARKAKNIASEVNDLRAQLQALKLNSSQQEFSLEQTISSLQDENSGLYQQLLQARQDREASNEMIQELMNDKQSLASENECLRQRIEELDCLEGVATNVQTKNMMSGTITNNNHYYYTTPSKGVPKNEDLE